jgi:hypothetical protein
MAGDWIPWCKGLARKPEVLAVAKATGRSRKDVATTLMEFWEWADDQSADGVMPDVGLADLPELFGGTDEAFWLAVIQAGWLQAGLVGIVLPNYERWLGRNAKRRLEKNRRQANWRAGVGAAASTKAPTTGQNSTEQGNPSTDFLSPEGEGEKTAANSKTTSARRKPPNALFDAVAEVTGSDPVASGSHVGRVCVVLRSADPPYTPDEVRLLPPILAERGFTLPATLGTVEKYIGWTRQAPPTLPRGGPSTTRRAETVPEKIARIRGETCKQE